MTLDLPLHLPPRDDAPRPAAPSAVPVALALGERHVGSVRRWLEGTLGWQAVDDDLDGPVPPTVRLVDLEGGMRLLDSGRTDRLPTLLLVEDDDVAALAADVARRLQPAGVCRWPDSRDALPDLVARTLGARRHGVEGGRVLRIGGVAGGVGRGLLTPARVLELAGGRRVVHVATSVRVARAVLRGHVPAGLPRTWLDALHPVLDAG